MHCIDERQVATYVARSVVCVFVCVLGAQVSFAKTAEPSEMLFWGLTLVGPRNHVPPWKLTILD